MVFASLMVLLAILRALSTVDLSIQMVLFIRFHSDLRLKSVINDVVRTGSKADQTGCGDVDGDVGGGASGHHW